MHKMDEIKRLLEARKIVKDHKPVFIRRDVHKKKKLKRNWRKPTGLDSKIRRRLKGRQQRISQGYRSPRKVRGLHKSGLNQARVCSFTDLGKLNPKNDCIILSSTLGAKKKNEILAKANSLGFHVVNSNVESYIKRIQEKIASNKKKKDEKKKAQEPKAKAESAKAPEKAVDEDKKEAEKKERDKVLTKKEN